VAADNSWRTLKALLLLSFALAMTGVVARNHAPDKGRRGNAAQTLSPRFKKLNEMRLLGASWGDPRQKVSHNCLRLWREHM
jgi:hypothetical protein